MDRNRIVFYLLSWCGIDALPVGSQARRPLLSLALIPVLCGLVSTHLLAATYIWKLIEDIETPLTDGRHLFGLIMNFVRHFSLKFVAALILAYMFYKRSEVKSLADEMMITMMMMSNEDQELKSEFKTSQKQRPRARPLVIYISAALVFIVGSQLAIYLSLWGANYCCIDPRSIPVFIPTRQALPFPIAVRVMLTIWDVYTYTVYVYGCRLGLAMLASLMCHCLRASLNHVDRDLRFLIRLAASDRSPLPANLRNQMDFVYREQLRRSLTRWERTSSMCDRMNGLLGLPLFLSLASDFLTTLIDITTVSVKGFSLQHENTVDMFNLFNFAYSLAPFVTIYHSGSLLSWRSDVTRSLTNELNILAHLRHLVHVSNANRLSLGDYPEVIGYNPLLLGNLYNRLETKKPPNNNDSEKLMNTQRRQHSLSNVDKNFTANANNPSRIIFVRNDLSQTQLHLVGLINIDRSIFLRLLAVIVSFSVMFIQLYPKNANP